MLLMRPEAGSSGVLTQISLVVYHHVAHVVLHAHGCITAYLYVMFSVEALKAETICPPLNLISSRPTINVEYMNANQNQCQLVWSTPWKLLTRRGRARAVLDTRDMRYSNLHASAESNFGALVIATNTATTSHLIFRRRFNERKLDSKGAECASGLLESNTDLAGICSRVLPLVQQMQWVYPVVRILVFAPGSILVGSTQSD
ncbi:hypothetical protein BDP27DRAFT_1403901 [Rhodocollybia butyracea]|uniref:Uncharacterized protein n=1 Tax=Rhodocollybia butyracea TaxID=206335 RepID=A0A9P5PNW8_9AGAR|nr:hypothetical protein BDP27DRAFT_1403901 [Rhodocollybia butyracea]